MAALDWPTTLYAPNSAGFQAGFVPNFVSDGAQVGAPRRRKRFTRSLRTFSFSIDCTQVQIEALETFYVTTTDGGVAEFNWTHPTSEDVFEVRFAEPIVISHVDVDHWRAEIRLAEI